MHWISLWWRQADHYEWLSGYLAGRGLKPFARYVMVAILSNLALAASLMLISPFGLDTRARVAGALVVGGLLGMALFWVFAWPTRVQSQMFAVGGTVGIAVLCLIEDDPTTGMVVCASFGGLAGYVAFFHSARLLTFTLGVALLSAAMCAERIGADGDIATAFSTLLFLGAGVLAVPFFAQIFVNWLSVVAVKSATDPLTGLRNRRGFHRSTPRLVAANRSGKYLSVLMIDLDDFKQVNDTHGHAAGDRMLMTVAENLRQAGGEEAVVARVGGEEFLVATKTTAKEALQTAEAMRVAIAANPWDLTVSVGVSSTKITSGEGDPYSRQIIDRLIEAADTAMYEAKRAGGNQVRHADTISQRDR